MKGQQKGDLSWMRRGRFAMQIYCASDCSPSHAGPSQYREIPWGLVVCHLESNREHRCAADCGCSKVSLPRHNLRSIVAWLPSSQYPPAKSVHRVSVKDSQQGSHRRSTSSADLYQARIRLPSLRFGVLQQAQSSNCLSLSGALSIICSSAVSGF